MFKNLKKAILKYRLRKREKADTLLKALSLDRKKQMMESLASTCIDSMAILSIRSGVGGTITMSSTNHYYQRSFELTFTEIDYDYNAEEDASS